jgi:alanine racemase
MKKTWVEISRANLRHNAAALNRWTGKAKLMPIVKANAYGHGLPQVVKALKGMSAVRWFGCDSLDEALQIRQSGAKQPILIMGYVPPDRLRQVLRNGFSQVAYNFETIDQLGQLASARRPARLHLKIETGTSRQGVWPRDLPRLVRQIQQYPHLMIEGASTHYANIEDTVDPSYAMGQLKSFNQALERLAGLGIRPEIRHTAASAAALLYPVTRLDLVRTGLALYGLWPSEPTRQVVLANGGPELKPAMTWKATVAQVKRLPKGTPVSYGLTEKVKRDSRVAVLPIGYWDGFDRHLSSTGSALINGRPAKVLGRVCMNMIVVDVTDCGRVKAGDPAVLLGRQKSAVISAEEMAERVGTINYEVVTRINPLIERCLI